jgi:hypothetical protein
MTTRVEETGNEWLPDSRHCPSWCDRTHAEALVEGNGWEDSQVHRTYGGGDCLTGLTHAERPVRDWGGSWNLDAQQRPLNEHGGFWGPPLITLGVSSAAADLYTNLELTSGEARVLARQLIALADKLDL